MLWTMEVLHVVTKGLIGVRPEVSVLLLFAAFLFQYQQQAGTAGDQGAGEQHMQRALWGRFLYPFY